MQWRVVVAVVALMAGQSGVAEEAASNDVRPIEVLSPAAQQKAPPLKFKRGPTCMCAHGTSEEEIRQAEEKRDSAGKMQDR